jgi:hypothetical protein
MYNLTCIYFVQFHIFFSAECRDTSSLSTAWRGQEQHRASSSLSLANSSDTSPIYGDDGPAFGDTVQDDDDFNGSDYNPDSPINTPCGPGRYNYDDAIHRSIGVYAVSL